MVADQIRKRTAVLISGRGSNLQALIAAAARPESHATIALVVSDWADAAGMAHAANAGIPSQAIEHAGANGRESFESALHAALQQAEIELVCLAGFMRILSPWLTTRWHNRLLNIHPSLLPAFPGLDTHERALEAGVRFSGCTVHFIRARPDAGPIIAQAVVPVAADDTPGALAARVLRAEHRLYPRALELVASGRARVQDERVVIAGATAGETMLFNPQD